MRKFIFISSGILFILVSAGLIAAGASSSDKFLVITSAMAIPFLFTGYWNIYGVFYEKKINYLSEYFVSKTISSAHIGAFYHKDIAVPVFLIMFITVSAAICTAFFDEEIGWAIAGFSFLYSLSITIIYHIKLGKKVQA